MKFNVNKFKKVSADEHSTKLLHPEGHEITIAHKHISPKMRGELESMPMEKSQHMFKGGLTQNPEFQDNVAKKELGMAVNAGMPGTSLNPLDQPTAPVDLGQFKDQAETQAAKDSLTKDAILKDESKQQFTDQMSQVQKDNDIRKAAGLPLLDPPALPPNVESLPQPGNVASAAPEQQISQQASPLPPQAQAQDPYGVDAYYSNISKGIAQEKQGLQNQYLAESATGKAQAADLQKAVDQQKTTNDLYTQNVNELSKERAHFIKDYQDQHIDPNHVWNEKSTVGKIGTVVGMIVSGLGAGLTGQENLASKILNQQIDRDMEAQKLEVGKKFNLLAANREQFQNEHDAMNMTRINLNDLVSNQMKMEAAKTTDMMAKGRLLREAGQIDQKNAGLFSQLAMRRAIMGGAKTGAIDPSQAVRVIVPEHLQAAAYKELGEALQMNKAKDNILLSFDKLSQLNTVGNRISSPLQSSRQVAAIRDPLLAGLSKETAGRFTEADSKFLGTLFPSPGDSAETLRTKRNQIYKIISEKMNFPLLQSYGINPGVGARTDVGGQSKIQHGPVK